MSDSQARFAFGDNWNDYADRLTPAEYERAKQSLQTLLPDVKDGTFLDVGCGSGLFSIAASALGASRVVGTDYDAKAIETAGALISKVSQWDPAVRAERIAFRVESILDEPKEPQTYDVVYSWGVLHHTGNMALAFERIISWVAPGGTLAIAIYNKHFTAPIWKGIKRLYVHGPGWLKRLLVWKVYTLKLLTTFITTGQNPFKRRRGMRYYNDIVDWVGGYPYEYASIEAVTRFFEQRGFETRTVNPTRGYTGCNEFVFRRESCRRESCRRES